jgi:hypothetical protein
LQTANQLLAIIYENKLNVGKMLKWELKSQRLNSKKSTSEDDDIEQSIIALGIVDNEHGRIDNAFCRL